MKNIALFLVICCCFQIFSCSKDSESEKFKLLTGPVWASDSLLVNGEDASGPGELLENFKGDVKFNEDYTGNFGILYRNMEIRLRRNTDCHLIRLPPYPAHGNNCRTDPDLIKNNNKLPVPPTDTINIRMTFKAK